MKNPNERANELQNLINSERTKRHTTTAVGNTEQNLVIVGTNEEYMRAEIKMALLKHENPAKSRKGNHAEENIIDYADEKKLKISEIGASRPICFDCEIKIKEKGIISKTKFSGKKSRSRKNTNYE